MRKEPIVFHVADIHYRDADYDEIKKCVDFLVKKVQNVNPDLIIISGDIFDRQDIKIDSKSARAVISQLKQMSLTAPIAIIIGTPSHDGTSAKIMRHIHAKHTIWVSDKPEQLYLYGHKLTSICKANAIPDITISQLPTPTKKIIDISDGIAASNEKLIKTIDLQMNKFKTKANVANAKWHILNGHFSIAGAKISPTQLLIGNDIEISHEQLISSGADIIMLGHIHYHQKIYGNIFYSGSIYRKTFGELDNKGFYMHKFTKTGIVSTFYKTPARMLLKYDFNFTRKNSKLEPTEFNQEILSTVDKNIKNAWIKITIEVYQDEARAIDILEIHDILTYDRKANKATINIIRKPRINIRAEKILKLTMFEDKIRELANMRDEEIQSGVIKKARMLESFTEDKILEHVLKEFN